MEQEHQEVAKLIVRIRGFSGGTFLFSRKKAKGTPKHGMLELLGGGVDGEPPLDGLVRELEEEEKSGLLARRVRLLAPEPRVFKIDGIPHHIFELSIDFDHYLDLRHSSKESLGFKVVPASMLRDDVLWSRLTEKTQRILAELGGLT